MAGQSAEFFRVRKCTEKHNGQTGPPCKQLFAARVFCLQKCSDECQGHGDVSSLKKLKCTIFKGKRKSQDPKDIDMGCKCFFSKKKGAKKRCDTERYSWFKIEQFFSKTYGGPVTASAPVTSAVVTTMAASASSSVTTAAGGITTSAGAMTTAGAAATTAAGGAATTAGGGATTAGSVVTTAGGATTDGRLAKISLFFPILALMKLLLPFEKLRDCQAFRDDGLSISCASNEAIKLFDAALHQVWRNV
uniref:Uncharacterized protein n=1 Tax=Romanomermis culicivorax TaxID=13658 RepID=A0A915IX95_ROMCU